jgi:tRNA A-37 threonylcarbamoyl transferase component Bud32
MIVDDPASPQGAAMGGNESFFRERLDALGRGESSIEDLIAAGSESIAANPESAWELLALADQYYRRHQLRGDAYRTIKQKFERRMLGVLDTGNDLLACAPGAEARVPTLGRLLRDRYVIEAFLGEGTRATVVRALDRFRLDLPMCGRHVAIKILRDDAADAQTLTELRREFQCSQRLAHPNITKVFEIDRDGDTTFFTMEPLQGEGLHRMLTRFQETPLARMNALTLIRKIGEALQHAHSRGVVHGNLRARKVFITEEGDIRVFGFGANEGAGRADDLHALAALAYELLTNVPPFSHRVDDRGRDLEPRRAGEPRRRPGLSPRHWKAIEIGLSSRARLISVGDWLDLMGLDRCPERLPGRLGTAPPRPSRYAHPEVGPLALMAAAIGGFGLAFLWRAQPGPLNFERPIAAANPQHQLPLTSPVPAREAEAPLGNWSVAANLLAAPTLAVKEPTSPFAGLSDATPLIAAPPVAALRIGALSTSAPPIAVASDPARTVARAAHQARETHAISAPLHISAPAYSVSPSQSLASFTVRRTPGTHGDINFVWWTENATARAGEDYIAVGQKIERMPAGNETMSFLIPIAPKAVRANKRFYVVAQSGGSGGPVQRATVVLKAVETQTLAAAR